MSIRTDNACICKRAADALIEAKARNPLRLPPNDNWRRYLKPIPINTRDVGKLLREYLRVKEPTLVRPLYSTWTAQAAALKYQELRNAVRDGQLSVGVLNRWQQQYSKLIATTFDPAWRAGLTHGGSSAAGWLRTLRLEWEFPGLSNRAEQWIDQRGASLVTSITRQQRDAVQSVIRHMVVDQGAGVDELAKVLRPVVGLTRRDAGAVLRMRGELIGTGLERGAVDHAVGNYAGYLHRRRAEMIARTELASAVNEGHLEAFREAHADGTLTKPVRKTWQTAEDEFVCEVCGPMNGQEADLDGSFDTDLGPLDRPPMHPNCRCDVLFEVML